MDLSGLDPDESVLANPESNLLWTHGHRGCHVKLKFFKCSHLTQSDRLETPATGVHVSASLFRSAACTFPRPLLQSRQVWDRKQERCGECQASFVGTLSEMKSIRQ